MMVYPGNWPARFNLHSYRSVLLIYAILFLALTFPYWLKGEVVAPDRQAAVIGAPENRRAVHLENPKFGDYPTSFIPQISQLMDGPRSGWLTLWSARNELGQPLLQLNGFSPAYPPTWLIARLTKNPWRIITILSLSVCFFAGLFVLMLSRELRLTPLAGLLAGGSLAASPLFMYWLTFPMFPAVWCWSAGVLYAVTRLNRELDLLGWSILAFSTYSLLMMAYPQPIVFHAYLVTGYVACLTFRLWQSTGCASAFSVLAFSTSAVAIGGALALPVYLDLVHIASESARLAPDPSFFMDVLPKIDSLASAIRFLALSTFPEILSNPILPEYPFAYDGVNVTPLILFLALLGALLCWRETWGWWLAIAVFCALALVHPLYGLGVKYLGFNLSQSTPLGSIGLPLTMIAAHGADTMIRRASPGKLSKALALAVVGTVAALLITAGFAWGQGLAIRWWTVASALLVIGLLALQFDKNRPLLLIAALVVVGAYVAFPLMLRQEPSDIATTSPLIEKLRHTLTPDSRFAVAAPGLAVLPPNLNASFRLASVHSYNSLSSWRFHTLIQALGGKVETYGRWNASIAPDYGGAMFWMSNVSVMLSPTRLKRANLDYLGQIGSVHLHRVASRMGCCLQVILAPGTNSVVLDNVQIADPRTLVIHQPVKTSDQGDLLEFDLQSSQASLLMLSQKFHRDWKAETLTVSGWMAGRTVPVNGVFQGVWLPEGTQKLRLQFLPSARFAWIAHVFWMIVLVAFASQALRRRLKAIPASEKVSMK